MIITDFTNSIEFQMSLLLFVALAGYLLASRINQSAVIGEILVGILIGPSFLALISYTDFIKNIASLGAIILLFVVGLEFRIKDIFSIRYGVIALMGVIIPWIGGFYVSKAFGFNFASAIFIGTALTATSIAITANVLREMGKLQTKTAKAIIGAAVIDDVLSLLILAFADQIVNGELSFIDLSFISLKAIAFIIIGVYVGHKYISKIILKIDMSKTSKEFPEFIFIFAMMVAFFYAMVAEYLNLSAIVGAFLAGVSLEGVVLRNGKDYREGAEYLHIIFASIFFISLGIIVDLHFLTPSIMVFVVVLTLVAIFSKVIGCYIPSKLLGFSNKESIIIGVGMVPRGEVAMIIAVIGLNSGIIMQNIYIAIILMSVFTTILTPLVLKNWIYKS